MDEPIPESVARPHGPRFLQPIWIVPVIAMCG